MLHILSLKKKQQAEAAEAAAAAAAGAGQTVSDPNSPAPTPGSATPAGTSSSVNGTGIGSLTSLNPSTSSLQSHRSDLSSISSSRAGGSNYALLRLQKDISELDLPSTMRIYFPEGERDLMHFDVYISPDEGLYKGGTFKFSFAVTPNFPHEPPKVLCTQRIYHPNIDLQGHVCLNILRQDWKPVLSIDSILVGLQFLFLEPNPTDPLNKEAATQFVKNRDVFKSIVRNTMCGGSHDGYSFDTVLTDRVGLPSSSNVSAVGSYK
ncbi:uncharacterized protein SAPINGB_P004315 [Magnusiomyces paraingens]|uniref:NEDD8-conjugating enzyme UBC12 n=1 Tax=Magnusiomyces paraingens TaxID=2606893 RepID=A0A5E8BTU3_9ASCO|nr:uncharacterized protein SAPINGB_P004315 [Saprochaete ingens]VVT54893.1 unnamed protein product [Saprochaete ingens]